MRKKHVWIIERRYMRYMASKFSWFGWFPFTIGGLTRKQGRHELKRWQDTAPASVQFRLVKYIAEYNVMMEMF